MQPRTVEKLTTHFVRLVEHIDQKPSFTSSGYISSISGMKIGAVGINVAIGTMCSIIVSKDITVTAEVVGFKDQEYYLIATDETQGLKHGMKVIPNLKPALTPVGEQVLGRVLDGMGIPIDNKGPLLGTAYAPLTAKLLNPINRRLITTPLDVGVRTINSLFTVGKGQRLGIFAGSGVGKSILLGMMTRFTQADVVVVALIGERGREVKEFVEHIVGSANMKKTVVVAAPADVSPIIKINGATLATSIAEYFRDQGLDVLLILDSLTRYAQAQRQIGLAAGELPANKGFTPSVFSKVLQLIERSGNGEQAKGSITAFYTILIEADDYNDPIADHTRSILDGHIYLSRELANAGHYPAIDPEASISRVMPSVATQDQINLANKFKKMYSCYQRNKEFIQAGLYHAGSDKLLDEALSRKEQMTNFLCQEMNEHASFKDSIALLNKVLM